MSINVDLIFDEIVEVLVSWQSLRHDYVTYLSRANRLMRDKDYRGLLDLLDELQEHPQSIVQSGSEEDELPVAVPRPRRRVTKSVRYCATQRAVLRHHFYEVRDHWPSIYMRTMLANLMNVQPRNIYFWFANERRTKNIPKPAADVPPVLTREQEHECLLRYRCEIGRPDLAIPMYLDNAPLDLN